MTIASTLTKKHYEGNGITKEFPLPFHLVDKTHVFAMIKNDKEIQEITKNFSVDLVKKTFTYPVSGEALPKGTRLTVYRKVPLTQIVDLENAGAFHPEVLEKDGFDRIVMQIQQLDEAIERTLKLNITDDRDVEGLLEALFFARDEAVKAANNAKQSEISANKSEVNTKNYAHIARAWAESPTPPNPQDLNSKSAKEWAKEAGKGGVPATPTEAGKVSYDNVTIKAKADGKSTLYTPLLSAVSAANTINSVTSKAVADYAVGKNVNNILVGRNEFKHREIYQSNQQLNVFGITEQDPQTGNYATRRFLGKNGIMVGEMAYSQNTKYRRFALLNVLKRQYKPDGSPAEPGKYYHADIAINVDNNDYAWGEAPTPKAEHIGNYIATTKWVRDYGQTVKSLATRTSTGQVTLTNVIPNKPLFIIQEKWNGWSDTKITPKRGIINCLTSVNKSFYLGGSQYLALYTQHNQALIFIPNETTVIFDTVLAQDVLLNFYQ